MSAEIRAGLDVPLPARLAVGGGSVLLVAGWCWSPHGTIGRLELTVDGAAQPLLAHGMPRLDLLRASQRRGDDPHGHAYASGFWGLARLAPGLRGARIGLRASLEDGGEAELALGEVAERPSERCVAAVAPDPQAGPLVAICMATHDPPDDLLARQLDSVRAQTHANWVCVVSDDASRPERFAALERAVGGDARFVVSRSDRRLGFYRNFERALELAPREAAFVALADQDDAWHPEKLATLLSAIGPARLACSDARIVGRGGELRSGTFWDVRAPDHGDLLGQLVANAVTGAASLFPRDLLEDALPFPPAQWNHFHDHWLGLVALATGEIRFVDRPLYDYVQHEAAAIGHEAANRMVSLRDRWTALRRDGRRRVGLWRGHYFADALRLMALAQIVEMRAGARIPRRKRRVLARYAAAERSPAAILWLFARGARELLRRRPRTLGAEWMLGYAFLWRRLLAASARPAPQRALRLDAVPPDGLGRRARRPAGTLPPGVAGVADKIAPLTLHPTDAPPRVNVLIPTLDLEHFFAGYIGKLNLALRLARHGRRVRVVLTDPGSMLPGDRERARRAIESYAGLAGLFSEVELVLGRADGGLEVSREDRFVATTWWTAHLADAAARDLGSGPFLYLIQEYEPLTFPSGSWAALAEASYGLPHTALFSTELLRGWFRDRGIGVYAAGAGEGDARSAVFANAITPVEPPTERELAERGTRRLLFYARPEPHAARNLYELGLLALRRAVADGALAGWELRGVGTTALGRAVPVGDATLSLLPRTSQAGYAALLPEHDLGLALMHTPHPSLVPIEMAAAGLVTVTSTYPGKTTEALSAISPNIVGAEPTVDGVAAALATAAAACGDTAARVANADVRWPRSWDEALGDRLIERVLALLEPG